MRGTFPAWALTWILAIDPGAAFAAGAPADTTASTRVPQRDLLDLLARLLGRRAVKSEYEIERRRGLSITLLPSVGYNPSYGAFIGVSAAAGGTLGDPANTTISKGSAGASYSTTGQISFQVKSDFFTSGNRYALKGDWRYLDTSQPTYGLGPAEPGQAKQDMEFVLYRFYQTIYRHVSASPMYVGVGYYFNLWDQITEPDLPPGASSAYRDYSGGAVERSTSSGVSVNVLYDSRDNPINAASGLYWDASLRTFQPWLGSDDSWQATWSDLRVYPRIPAGGRNTLAIWSTIWFTFGKPPYLDLPATGWDTYGRGARGYLQGRIRGQDQIYTEAEYRMPLTRDGLLGAVVFLNLTATTEPNGGQFGVLDPGGGVGGRLKFSKRTNTNLTVDAAWGEFGQAHFFFGMQEVF